MEKAGISSAFSHPKGGIVFYVFQLFTGDVYKRQVYGYPGHQQQKQPQYNVLSHPLYPLQNFLALYHVTATKYKAKERKKWKYQKKAGSAASFARYWMRFAIWHRPHNASSSLGEKAVGRPVACSIRFRISSDLDNFPPQSTIRSIAGFSALSLAMAAA